MHSMDNDRPPKRLAVTSLTSAQAAIERWLHENRLVSVRDAEGMDWRLTVLVDHVPDPESANGLLWRVRLKLATSVMPAELIAMGVLDAAKDARLLELINGEPVDLAMKPMVYTAPNEEALRLLAAEELPRLRDSMAQRSLIDVKRQLIGRLVDQRGRFGG